jgi:phosphoserine aminotransferase
MIYNFNAGPAMLPREVMQIAKDEFTNYQNSGMSIMEMSHRGSHFSEILDSAEKTLRKLMNISQEYTVLFYPAGATLQFSAIPLNILGEGETADYVLTGVWAKKSFEEAKKLGYPVRGILDAKENNYTIVPEVKQSDLNPNSKYLYITSNNTIYGTRYKKFPVFEGFPLIADMTSDILSRKMDVNSFGVIFAGAQKNIVPSGLSILIIKNSYLNKQTKPIPVLLDYSLMAKNKSIYNTPPTYAIYIAKLVFEWCVKMGGVDSLEKINEEKAKLLYDYLDNSDFYFAPVEKNSRSTMNVVFLLKNKDLENKFNIESENAGLHGLAGHRDVGGFRASIYNAMPIEGIHSLLEFLENFKKKNS